MSILQSASTHDARVPQLACCPLHRAHAALPRSPPPHLTHAHTCSTAGACNALGSPATRAQTVCAHCPRLVAKARSSTATTPTRPPASPDEVAGAAAGTHACWRAAARGQWRCMVGALGRRRRSHHSHRTALPQPPSTTCTRCFSHLAVADGMRLESRGGAGTRTRLCARARSDSSLSLGRITHALGSASFG